MDIFINFHKIGGQNKMTLGKHLKAGLYRVVVKIKWGILFFNN